jgi:RNA-directed DNA polymerase
LDKKYTDFEKEDFVDACNKVQGLLSAIKNINVKKPLDMYINTLTFIRKKYNVPYRRTDIFNSFKTDYGKVEGDEIHHTYEPNA